MRNKWKILLVLTLAVYPLKWSYGADESVRHYSAKEAKQQLGFSNENEMEFIGAAAKGDVGKIRGLLTTGIDINGKYGVMQQTALDMAANKGQMKAVEFLVSAGAGVNNRGTLGWTPIMHAANNGHKEIVKFLIEHGADVNASPPTGGTLVQLAQKYPEIVQLLKAAGAREKETRRRY